MFLRHNWSKKLVLESEATTEITRTKTSHSKESDQMEGIFGLPEKDVLCVTMTVTVGVDLGFSWGVSF